MIRLEEKKNTIIVVVGPTASGKSELGVRIAKKTGGEIISADSRQVYRGLDRGSGKVPGKWVFRKEDNNLPLSSPSLRRRGKEKREYLSFLGGGYNYSLSREYDYKCVRHHCLDVADPKKTFTAADFIACGRRAITDILSRGKTPIIVGGTGFYIDALLGKIPLASVPANPVLRKKLSNYTTSKLFSLLKKFDPERAKTIDKNNPRRLIRAIEIAKTQLKRSEILSFSSPHPANAAKIVWLGINCSPEDLKRCIHKRLITRLPGIIREVKKLHRRGVSWKRLYDLGLEYRYVSLYVRRKMHYKLMTAKLQTAIWHYARRQIIWWKKNKEIHWFNASEEALKYARKILI